jgi:hypothetical protein
MNNRQLGVYSGTFYLHPLKGLHFFFILIVAIWGVAGCTSSKQNALGTYDDPEIALKETQKLLTKLSQNINLGYKSVAHIDEYEITKNKLFNLE